MNKSYGRLLQGFERVAFRALTG